MSLRDYWDDGHYWVEEKIKCLNECGADGVEKMRRMYPRLIKRVFRTKTLELTIAIASVVAAWFSYQAAERSSETALTAQRFSEQVTESQILLARPRIVALGGSITKTKVPESDTSPWTKTIYTMQVRLKNSGGRDALPAIIVLRVAGSSEKKVFELNVFPKDTELTLSWEERDLWRGDGDVMVGALLGDDVPSYVESEQKGGEPGGLSHRCHPIEISSMRQLTPKETETALSPGLVFFESPYVSQELNETGKNLRSDFSAYLPTIFCVSQNKAVSS